MNSVRRAASAVLLMAVSCTTAQPPASLASPTPVFVTTVAPPPSPSAAVASASVAPARLEMVEYPVGRGQGPHDVAPATDGGVWYTAQLTGELGYLDPKTGATRMVKLGTGSAPHGVIVGPDGAPWVTDGGLNAIVRVDPKTNEVTRYPLSGPNVNLNTATFDKSGTLWFTGQSGFYGYLKDGKATVLPAPRGPGPYGITTCDNGFVYYASLAGNYVGRIDIATREALTIDPPTKGQGARRVWCGTASNVWVSEWNAGQVARYITARSDPLITGVWREWKLPGPNPMAYAVFVDDQDIIWLTDFGANAIVRFDPKTETFTSLPFKEANANVRQLLGRQGEVWGAESGRDRLVVVRTR